MNDCSANTTATPLKTKAELEHVLREGIMVGWPISIWSFGGELPGSYYLKISNGELTFPVSVEAGIEFAQTHGYKNAAELIEDAKVHGLVHNAPKDKGKNESPDQAAK